MNRITQRKSAVQTADLKNQNTKGNLNSGDYSNLSALGYSDKEINSSLPDFPKQPPKNPSSLWLELKGEKKNLKKVNSFSAKLRTNIEPITKSSNQTITTTKQTFQPTSNQDVTKEKPMEKINEFISNPIEAIKNNIVVVVGAAAVIIGGAVYFLKFHKSKKR